MEWKKFGYGNGISSLVASTMELKKLASTIKSRRATMFVSGFAFTLLLCSVFLAFNYPYKLVMNPMLQKQSRFPSLFGSGSDNYSHSKSIFSFIFSNADSCSSAVCHRPTEDSKKSHASDTVTRKMNDEEIKGDGMGRNGSNENGTLDIVGTNNTKNATEFLNSTGIEVVQGDLNKTVCFNCTDGKGHRTERTSGLGSAAEVVSKQDKTSPSKPAKPSTSSPAVKPGLDANGTQLGAEEISNASSQRVKHCDIFSGRWVRDDSNPHYPPGSCPHIDESFNCFNNKRLDNQYEKWRWQPSGCSIPRLNAKDMLERLRGKRLVFVGDSLNRNMWESMVCILRHAVSDKARVREISGRKEFRTEGFYAFRYEDYNCSVEFVRAPFLVQEWEMNGANGTKSETLRLDLIDSSSPKYVTADIIVFNTGHWWTHEKTSKGKDYYQEGDHVYPELNVLEAYRKALTTWAKWVDQNINSNRTQVFFRGYSATHFSGGQWNSGGQCHKEYEPIYNQSYLTKYPPKMVVLESVIKEMRTPVIYLNVTRITDYRKDGHPSIYRKHGLSQQEMIESERYQDCSHWCLPGVPDTWNELLYASLVTRHQAV